MRIINHGKRWKASFLFFLVFGFVTHVCICEELTKINQSLPTTTSTQELKAVEEGNTICPVTGEKIEEGTNVSAEYKGKIYKLCCSGCTEEFKNNPQKYVSKIKDIKLEAFQFEFSPNTITVKKGDIVRIFATSRDVTHGIYIKEYGINSRVSKGKDAKIEFLADKAGSFDIICHVYCGKGHNDMKAKLIVQE